MGNSSCDDASGPGGSGGPGAVVDTRQVKCYDNDSEITPPAPGEPFYGQDAQYDGVQPKYQDKGDGTVTDLNTCLMWQQTPDYYNRMSWYDAVDYADNLTLAGYDDWRPPNAKELQIIVDYMRNDPAIDPVFQTADPTGWFWTSTTHGDNINGEDAVYVCFGKGVDFRGMDVHGAGALRCDPKAGDPADYPNGRGPQNDDVKDI